MRKSTDPLPLLTGDIMDLLNLWQTSTYFQYTTNSYTVQLSQVSVVVAEIMRQNI